MTSQSIKSLLDKPSSWAECLLAILQNFTWLLSTKTAAPAKLKLANSV